MQIRVDSILHTFLQSLKGWQRYGFLFVIGTITALAMPPVGWVFVLFLTFPLLLACLDTLETLSFQRAFLYGWSFSLGYFVAGLYWLVVALSVDWQQFFWLVPFTLFGLPSILALFQGLALAITHYTRTTGITRCLIFALSWTVCEWLRGHLFTGFPWNLIGYGWDRVLPMLQFTAYTGIYGLSLVTVLMASLPAVWLTSASLKKRLITTSALVILGVTLWGGGTWRLANLALPNAYEKQQRETVLRIVQPNIPQSLKWDPTKARENFLKLLSLSREPSSLPITDLIWPESALPVYLDENHAVRSIIADVIPRNGSLLTGAIHRHVYEGRTQQIWTSLMALNKHGEILGFYDKAHLVPFGEYIPFRAYLPQWIRKLTPGNLDYTPGPHMKTFTLPHTYTQSISRIRAGDQVASPMSIVNYVTEGESRRSSHPKLKRRRVYSLAPLPPFSPLVCYEAIFPGEVVNKHNMRPQWLVNITNDAWYGMTSGPYQHFAMVRVRAIEEGLPLIRAANNGISGAMDAYGHILATLGLGKTGVLDVALPPALKTPTLYNRWGDSLFLALLLGMSLSALICRWFKI